MSEEHSKQTSEVLKRQISELEGINDTLSQGLYWFLTFTAYSAVWLRNMNPEDAALNSAAMYQLLHSKLGECGWLEKLKKEERRIEPLVMKEIGKQEYGKDALSAVEDVLQHKRSMN